MKYAVIQTDNRLVKLDNEVKKKFRLILWKYKLLLSIKAVKYCDIFGF